MVERKQAEGELSRVLGQELGQHNPRGARQGTSIPGHPGHISASGSQLHRDLGARAVLLFVRQRLKAQLRCRDSLNENT